MEQLSWIFFKSKLACKWRLRGSFASQVLTVITNAKALSFREPPQLAPTRPPLSAQLLFGVMHRDQHRGNAGAQVGVWTCQAAPAQVAGSMLHARASLETALGRSDGGRKAGSQPPGWGMGALSDTPSPAVHLSTHDAPTSPTPLWGTLLSMPTHLQTLPWL